MSDQQPPPYIGAIYRSGVTWRQVTRVVGTRTIEVQELATISLNPTQSDSPTYHYVRRRLQLPLRPTGEVVRARWTAKSGWGISLIKPWLDKPKRFALGTLVVTDFSLEEAETYTFVD